MLQKYFFNDKFVRWYKNTCMKKPTIEQKVINSIVLEAQAVYNEYGPGLMDNFYEIKLLGRLRKLGLNIRKRVANGFPFETRRYARMFRVDIIIEETLILEVKCSDYITDFFVKQVSQYLHDTDIKLGLIVNFGRDEFRDCVKKVKPMKNTDEIDRDFPLREVI